MSESINILITDDHEIVRLGASIAVTNVIPKAKITQASNFEETLHILKNDKFLLLLLDINMPGGNNIKMIENILAIQPDIKILVFSSYEESIYALRYIQAGAMGYVHKNSTKEELKNAIITVVNNQRYMSDEIQDLYFDSILIGKHSKLEANPLNKLSNREMDVARHLTKGLGIVEISKIMNLKNSTISTYKGRIFEKLQVDNIPDLIEIQKLYEKPI